MAVNQTSSVSVGVAYHDNQQLLQALQSYAQALIEQYLLRRTRATNNDVENKLDQLLRVASMPANSNSNVSGNVPDIDDDWNTLQINISATQVAGFFLPWIHLVNLFGLVRKEQELLAFILLAEIQPKFSALIASLAVPTTEALTVSDGQLAKGLPLAGIAVVLGATDTDSRALLNALQADSSLRYWDLINVKEEGDASTLQGSIHFPVALRLYLQGKAAPQLVLEQPLKLFNSSVRLQDHLVSSPVIQQLIRFTDLLQEQHSAASFVLQLQGPDASLARSLSAACAASIGMGCAILDGRGIWQLWQNQQRQRPLLLRRLRALCRDAMLCNRIFALQHCQWLCAQDSNEDLFDDVIKVLLESQICLVIINGPVRRISDAVLQFEQHVVAGLLLKIGIPDVGLRKQIWQRHAAAFELILEDLLLTKLTNGFQFTEEQVVLVLKEFRSRQMLSVDALELSDMLLEICREQSQREVMTVAQEVKNAWKMRDIVLVDETQKNMNEVLQYAQQRHQVIEEWGFAEKNQNSRNLCVLFYGPSGTGKTMAASIIANELNLGLYRIDLANIVSKYIGETEKHLAQLFDQAEAMNIVLFFDEAESLFSKRTETKDSHDRYANLQTGYLLQRIESYSGIVILSTNLLGNIDKAFTRRFKFMIEFPFPDTVQRLQLWRSVFPAQTPLGNDVDLQILAERAALSGGSIHNIAIGAAFLAASEKSAVSQQHLLQAIAREYGKLGKVFHAGDFVWED